MDKINPYSSGIHGNDIPGEYIKSSDTYNNANYLTNAQGQIVGFEYEGKKVLLPKNTDSKIQYTKKNMNQIIDSYIALKTATKNADEIKRASRNSSDASPSVASSYKLKTLPPNLNATKFHQKLKEFKLDTDKEHTLDTQMRSAMKELLSLLKETKQLKHQGADSTGRTLADNVRDIKIVNSKLAVLKNKKDSMIKRVHAESNVTRKRRTSGSIVNFSNNIAKGIALRPSKKRIGQKRLRNLLKTNNLFAMEPIKEENEEELEGAKIKNAGSNIVDFEKLGMSDSDDDSDNEVYEDSREELEYTKDTNSGSNIVDFEKLGISDSDDDSNHEIHEDIREDLEDESDFEKT